MTPNVTVTRITEAKGAVCGDILRGLPEWFGIEESVQNYIREVESQDFFTASIDGRIIGFISLKAHNRWTAEVFVMGVKRDGHRRGIGTRLLETAEEFLRYKGYKYLQVKTLGPSRPNDEYEMTRRFYEKTGFVPVEEFRTLWGEANPCLLMIKNL